MAEGVDAPPCFPERRASSGKAALFNLASIDRTDHPAGLSYGAPGGPATNLLSCKDTGDDVDLAVAFEAGSKFILYAVEELGSSCPYLIFLEMPTAEVKESLICEEAFIDRGARRVADLGCRVLVATLETAEELVKKAALDAALAKGEWNLSVIWNTGRCGSTLMHKALLACGVGSFSEPQWLDQLCFTESAKVEPKILTRAFKTCWLLDIHLLRKLPSFQDTVMFSLNPKTSQWLTKVGIPISDAFPGLRHCFMYRACDKVVESFASLFKAIVPEERIAATDARWRQNGTSMLDKTLADNLKAPLNSGKVELQALESFDTALRTLFWLNCLNAWRNMQGLSAQFAEAPVVRMDEFVSKDLSKRHAVVGEVLLRLGVVENLRDEKIPLALEVFNENSQKNSAMGGAKKVCVSDQSRKIIFQCVSEIAPLIPGVKVEGEGSNVLLPGSVGTSAAEDSKDPKKLRSGEA